MLHKNVLVGDNHILHNWEVADAIALGALVVVAADCGKLAWQKDIDQFFFLSSAAPVTWKPAVGKNGVDGVDGTNGVSATTSIRGAFSGPVVASVGTMRYYIRDSIHVSSIFANLSGPATAAVTVDIKKNGVTVQTVSIPIAQETSTTVADIALLPDDYITLNVIGGTGNDLAVRLDYERVV